MLGVIPARLGSVRLPRKPLQRLADRPLIEWVWYRMERIAVLDQLVVAADDPEVVETVEGFGGQAVLTRTDHASGSDRVAEVAERPEFRPYEWILNLQGDEPFLPLEAAEAAVRLVRSGWDVGTAAVRFENEAEWRSPSAVKVICGDDGGALFFSRAAIPYARQGAAGPGTAAGAALKHLGVYAFTRGALRRGTALPRHSLEEWEGLEQLRWLAGGLRIGVATVEAGEGPGIDTKEELVRAEELLRRGEEHR